MPISEDDLQAYVDSALPGERRAEVEAFLAAHPDDAERVRAYRDQNTSLKALFDPILDEPIPDALRALASAGPAASQQGRLPRWSLQRFAASIAIAVIGGLIGWSLHGSYEGPQNLASAVPLARQAAVAHAVFSPEVRRPVEVSAENEEQLVNWLSKRIGKQVKPPRLSDLGYELIGGRLLPGNSGPVAQFMYQDAKGQRLTLYISTENTSNRETAFRFAQEGAVNVFYWIDGSFGYALSASIDKAELGRVATVVYHQIEGAGK
jgi:anti-sigma factor RsiW